MKVEQVAEEIGQKRSDSDQFIRWWRKENDFVDYELIDRFLENIGSGDHLEGYELIDTETMWHKLKDRLGSRVEREKHARGDMIVWRRPDKEEQRCLFSASSIMTIFDVETRGNVIEG